MLIHKFKKNKNINPNLKRNIEEGLRQLENQKKSKKEILNPFNWRLLDNEEISTKNPAEPTGTEVNKKGKLEFTGIWQEKLMESEKEQVAQVQVSQ